MNAQNRFVLTRAGYNKLQQELEESLAKQRSDQGYLADVSDSSDPTPDEATSEDARETTDRDDEHVLQLQRILADAEVIDEDPDPLRINVGDRVTVWSFADKQSEQFDLIGGAEVAF